MTVIMRWAYHEPMQTTTATATHQIIEVRAFEATEPGALSGHEAVCSCGYRMATSLSVAEAARLGAAHVRYMNSKEGK